MSRSPLEIPRAKARLFDDASRHVDRFGLLLLLTTSAVVVLSLVDLGSTEENAATAVGRSLVTIFVGATLVLALRASGVARRPRIAIEVFVAIGVASTLAITAVSALSAGVDGGVGDARPSLLWLVLSIFAPVLVVRRLLKHRAVTARTLLGAVSAFLLIALAFNFLFLGIEALQSDPFFGTDQPTSSFMYFSLVTITTLGYGDLAAAEPVGRLFTTMEAVIGQVYLVTFVGMVVGLLVSQRGSRQVVVEGPDEGRAGDGTQTGP